MGAAVQMSATKAGELNGSATIAKTSRPPATNGSAWRAFRLYSDAGKTANQTAAMRQLTNSGPGDAETPTMVAGSASSAISNTFGPGTRRSSVRAFTAAGMGHLGAHALHSPYLAGVTCSGLHPRAGRGPPC
jgi:hypothetical protein